LRNLEAQGVKVGLRCDKTCGCTARSTATSLTRCFNAPV
jgi:hypothetical protein